jgi:hypothetical protein
MNWTRASYAIPKGSHLLKWDYTKDYSVSNGGDAAWVDYIRLPAFNVPVGETDPEAEFPSLKIYPNPSNDISIVEFTVLKTSRVNLSLFDGTAKPVYTIADKILVPGKHKFNVDLKGLSAGIYYCVLTTSKCRVIIPLIITSVR